MANLSERAVLAKLEISMFQANRTDQQVTHEVAVQHNVDKKAGRYVKKILETETLNRIRSLGQDIRKWHNQHTLRWDEGVGILPSKMFSDYTDHMRQKRAEFDALVEQFVGEYPDALNEAAEKLNSMFNPADYPRAEEVVHKFGVRTVFYPLPEAADFHRTSCVMEQLQDMEDGLNDHLAETSKGISKELLGRLIEPIRKMAQQLAKDGSFNKRKKDGGYPLFESIIEAARLMAELNIEGDANVSAAISEIETAYNGWSPSVIRDNKVARKDALDDADALVKKLSAYMKK